MVLSTIPAGEVNVEGAGETLAEVVPGGSLERLAVANQRLQRVGLDGARKPLALALPPAEHGDGKDVLDSVGVDVVEDRQRLGDRLFLGLVRRVAFLPQELARAQEQAGPELPADYVRPLVVEQRQVAVGVHPTGVRRPDQRLRGWT